ncbi:MAG: aldehyde dehydrogenase family protein [Solirubrobacteraceae bacterium]|nr:aldehyde dehydrogenase family protein [Solirubrobacteraceae bacterium]
MDPSETGVDAATDQDTTIVSDVATAEAATVAEKVVAEPKTKAAVAKKKAPSLTVRNPSTGKIIAELPAITPEDVPGVVAKGRAAQARWEAIGAKARAEYFKKLRTWLWDHEAEFTDTISREGGKPIEDAFYLEFVYALSALDYWAKKGPGILADKRRLAKNRLFVGNTVVERHVPHGVVGIIGPWNYPFVNSIGDAIPALIAGNSVVLKPASKTPLTSLLIARGMREVGFPDDVFQVAVGPGPVGSAMVDNVDMIMFTGSTEVGKGVAKQAVDRLIPFSLELGGKDPLVVLDDADVQKAADHALYYSLVNGGQTCMSIERIYVDTSIYDEFVERLVAGFDKVSYGDPVGGVGTVEVGSMTVGSQADIIAEQVADAVAKGAKVVRGGKKVEKADGAIYFEPTILTEVTHGMEIVDEETFGPTIQIMRVSGTEEAIRLANDNQYGLAAAVYGKDLRRAENVARRIEAGTVAINDSLVFWAELQLELGGWKQSGAGDGRHGEVGILKYTKTQGLFISRMPLKRMPQMFPYGKTSGSLKAITKLFFRLPG